MSGHFSCGNCGAEVAKSARFCPKCNATLIGIRCNHCRFAGHEDDFPDNRCPNCGRSVGNHLDTNISCVGLATLAFFLPAGLYMLFLSDHQSRGDASICFFLFAGLGALILAAPKLLHMLDRRR